MTDYFARQRQLTGTTAEWAANDLVIGLGELAIEIVSPGVARLKMGDGARNYSALPYYDPASGSYVLKAGDTMTGTLTTPGLNVPDGGSATAPTMVYTDTSRHVATTAFVRNLLAVRGQGAAIYEYSGATFGTPSTGKVIIDPTVDPERHFAINATDADGVGRFLSLLQPGDSLVITNEFTPVTYYARYDLTSAVTDHTAWVEFTAHLIDFTGIAEAPALNTRLKLTGYLNLATGDGPILGVTAGENLVGGGSVGVVALAVKSSPDLKGVPTAPTAAPGTATLQVATTAFVAAAAPPAGSIIDYAGATAPAGWLLCQGQAVSRTTYAALYTALGAAASPWGQGDGTTTFNVPDLGGRVTAGKESTATRLTVAGAGINGAVLGASGGVQTYTLTTTQMPSHNHTSVSGNTFAMANMGGWIGISGGGGISLGYDTIAATGGGLAHQNTQPTTIINKIIKT